MAHVASPLENSPPVAAGIRLGPDHGWSRHAVAEGSLSLKGYVFDGGATLTGEGAARHLAACLQHAIGDDALRLALSSLAGHFAFVLQTPARIVASVDRIRSIPLLFATRDGTVHVDDRGLRLRDTLGMGPGDLDAGQVLAAAMSGYTVGGATLYRGIRQLRAGEALIVEGGGARTLRWFVYDAWRTEPMADAEARLSELHRFLIERLARSADGRVIAVPLSAGLDSRFLAAGLKAVGYRDVRLFSYGRPGNHEALTAKAIAERLGYPWTFVPFTTASQRAMFADPAHREGLWTLGDALSGVPFEQDWDAIARLRADGTLPPDALVVNGQSGDFITGNHAPASLLDAPGGGAADERRDMVLRAIVGKHFRLWDSLASPANDAVVAGLLGEEAREAGATFGPDEALHGIFEMLEYQDRQAKYVVAGQRCYEAQGLAWRLPLWDDELIAFWRRAPGDLKRRQSLYRRVLERDDWGGVFRSVPVNAKTITPRWIVPLRLAAKAAFAPAGRDAWHKAERRYFGWWMDPLRISTAVPYLTAARDGRGARHAVAWLAEQWLARHGVDAGSLHQASGR